METIPMLDADGVVRQIPSEQITLFMGTRDFEVFGMSMDVLQRLRAEYIKLGGRMPMTVATVTECFRRIPA